MPAGIYLHVIIALMTLHRVKAEWTGFNGAPGYSVFHFNASDDAAGSSADDAHKAVHDFFTAMVARLPSNVYVNVQRTVERIQEANGELIGFQDATTRAPVKGAAAGGFSSATGACIGWHTDGVRNGRRIRGRTFIVPLAGSTYDTDGTLASTALDTLNAAATALNDSFAGLVVYSRPSGPGATDGQFALVQGFRVADKTAILRSRRD